MATSAAIEALKDAVLKLSTQQDELIVHITEIKETISKQRDDVLLERIKKLEQSMKEQHIKLDSLNSIDLHPSNIDAPRPSTVRVAGAKKKVEDKPEEPEPEEPQQFNNITEYFKFLWVTDRQRIYDKGVYSEDEYNALYEENRDTFDKKKGNELVLQKSVAFKIWRSLDPKRKEIVQAMKNDHANAQSKRASKDVEAETED